MDISNEPMEASALSGLEVTSDEGRYIEVSRSASANGEYVIHVAQKTLSRPFPKDKIKFFSIIKAHLDNTLQLGSGIEVYSSPEDWDFELITIKAKNLAGQWNFYSKELGRPIKDMIVELEAYLDAITPKRMLR